MSKTKTKRMTLNFVEHIKGRKLQLAFGYAPDGEPLMALFVGDDDEPVFINMLMITMALEQGWETDYLKEIKNE
tara:strand:- start:7898 stop:8119 length:222 start_codon:yes stop_codon:yes gene_type:complete